MQRWLVAAVSGALLGCGARSELALVATPTGPVVFDQTKAQRVLCR